MALLCPSTMCINFLNLKNEIKELDQAGADLFHNDIMDGQFVPNMALGLNDIKMIRSLTKKQMDVHLMMENPLEKVDWFIEEGADLIYIHPEAERYVSKTLMHIKKRGKLCGLALNPDTSVEMIQPVLSLCDYILVMTVNPGFAGQSYLAFTDEKIAKLILLKQQYHYKIIIDGACSEPVISRLSKLGVDGFVLGTSALFGKEESYSEILKRLHEEV